MRYDHGRGTAAQRGYSYAWQRYRRRRLAEQPYCRDCYERGFVAASREVHHLVKVKDAPQLQFVDSNTVCLCRSCHARRTARGE